MKASKVKEILLRKKPNILYVITPYYSSKVTLTIDSKIIISVKGEEYDKVCTLANFEETLYTMLEGLEYSVSDYSDFRDAPYAYSPLALCVQEYLRGTEKEVNFYDTDNGVTYIASAKDKGWHCSAKCRYGTIKSAICLKSENNAYALTRLLFSLGEDPKGVGEVTRNFYKERLGKEGRFSTSEWSFFFDRGVLLTLSLCENASTVYCKSISGGLTYATVARNISCPHDLEVFLLKTLEVLR